MVRRIHNEGASGVRVGSLAQGWILSHSADDSRYELDILMTGAFGYNLPGAMGPTLGSLFVNKLIERCGDRKYHDSTLDKRFA